jgi:hypothetical protein
MASTRVLLLLLVFLERAAFYGAAVSLPNFLGPTMKKGSLTFILNGLFLGVFILPWVLEKQISRRFSRPAAIQIGLGLVAVSVYTIRMGRSGLLASLVGLSLSAAFLKPAMGSYADLWKSPVHGAVSQSICIDVAAALAPVGCSLLASPTSLAPGAETGPAFLGAVLLAILAFFVSLLLPDEVNPQRPFSTGDRGESRVALRRVGWLFVALVPFCAALQQGNSAALQHAATNPVVILGRTWGADGAFLVFGLTAALVAATCSRLICRWPNTCFWLGVAIVALAFVGFSKYCAGSPVQWLTWLALGVGESLSLPAASGLFVMAAPVPSERRSFQALFVLANGLGVALAFSLSGLYGARPDAAYFAFFAVPLLALLGLKALSVLVGKVRSWASY